MCDGLSATSLKETSLWCELQRNHSNGNELWLGSRGKQGEAMVGAKAGWSSRISFLSGFGLLTSSLLQTPVFPQQSSMENFSKLLLFLAFKFDSRVFLSLGKSLVFFQYFFFFFMSGN